MTSFSKMWCYIADGNIYSKSLEERVTLHWSMQLNKAIRSPLLWCWRVLIVRPRRCPRPCPWSGWRRLSRCAASQPPAGRVINCLHQHDLAGAMQAVASNVLCTKLGRRERFRKEILLSFLCVWNYVYPQPIANCIIQYTFFSSSLKNVYIP